MRPLKLELEGFTSFRERTHIDFSDADYFALVGPTGAGKSTVVDAICFALYGAVPRYEDMRVVAPVITQGQLEARVRLDFSVSGNDYTAVRIVRRQGKGATTKEARLECGTEVIAATAPEVTEAVERIVGLSFEHFTRCVVLPQGEFSRFLDDRPSDRQDLLVRLLNLDVYEKMRQRAAGAAAELKGRTELAERRLREELTFATEEALDAARRRVEQLGSLKDRIDAAAPQLAALESEAAAAEAQAESARAALTRISRLETPQDLGALSRERQEAVGALDAAQEEASAARDRYEKARAERDLMPERGPLAAALAAHERAARLEQSIAAAERRAAQEDAILHAKEADVARLTARLDAARRAQEDVNQQHLAQHLAEGLKKGQPCPVCLQTVVELPDHPGVPALQEAAAAVDAAERSLAQARSAAEAAHRDQAAVRREVEVLAGQLQRARAEMAGHADRDALEQRLKAIDAAEQEFGEARQAYDFARDAAEVARRRVDAALEGESSARERFDQARDGVADLEPPPPGRHDLVQDWEALVGWAQELAPRLRSAASSHAQSAAEARKRAAGVVEQLASDCRDCGVEVPHGAAEVTRLGELATASLERARAAQERVTEAIDMARKLQDEIQAGRREHEVAHALSQHLSAKGFEKWVVTEALGLLVTSASQILRDLSGGQYTLLIDGSGNFMVVDHHNAGETRSARTLSGGETFLASLSLALGLSDQIADLASGGAARLEAIFLDEGFGTLDPETLDTVAATVENLAAAGRMVGIVTHVRDLADRVPLQFRVSKNERTSTIAKVGS